MGSRRKNGYALDIPFVDSSSGYMVNGVQLGRPATPPVIRITVPASEQKLHFTHGRETPDEVDGSGVAGSSKNTDSSSRTNVENESANSSPSASAGSGGDGDDVNGSGKSEEGRRGSMEGDDEPGELKPSQGAPLQARHRRNSISLPAGLENLEIQVIPDDVHPDSDSYSESDYNTEGEETKQPLRNARKKSMMPLRGIDLDTLELPEQSPGNSITSVNSIASLLKEKLSMMALPGLLKSKRKAENYKLKSFVGFLFLCIVFLVTFAHVFYQQHVLQRAYFEMIRFNNEEKVVRVYGQDGEELLSGILGTTLNSDLVFKCQREDNLNDGSVCMEWMHRARLYLRYKVHEEGVRCYQFTWQSLNPATNPTDCFDWSKGGHWYGGGQTRNMSWPAELGMVQVSPFITGDVTEQQWGNVLQRFFLNSKGVAISIDSMSPLYVSVNTKEDRKMFCIQAQHDDFAYYYRPTLLPQLNYSICVSNNTKVLHGFFSEKSLWDGLKKNDIETMNSLLTEPIWQVGTDRSEYLTEATITNYTDEIILFPFLKQGHVLINELWQKTVGDLTMDEDRFPTMVDTMAVLNRRGFKVVLSVQPFISTESPNFKEAGEKKLLVATRGTDNIPALTRYKGVTSAAVLDITNNQSIPWLQEKLQAVNKKYKNSFFLDLGSAYNMPHYHKLDRSLINIDEYKTLFTEAVMEHVNVIGVSSAVKRPRPPVFVSLPPIESSWNSLTQIIPMVLTYGIIGYPFIMPGPVGGDYLPPDTVSNFTYMYLKSVENVITLKRMRAQPSKAPDTTENQNQAVNNSKTATTASSDNADNATQPSTSSVAPPVVAEVENDTMEVVAPVSPPKEKYDLLDDLFSKDTKAVDAEHIFKNITAANMTHVFDEANQDFLGDTMMGDQGYAIRFLPDKELYIRWLQLAYFLPVIRFAHLPSKYKDQSVLEMVKVLTALRGKTINPLMMKYAKEALDSGLPIIRPLWMLDPADSTCHTVVDEFSVGEVLIVAPVIQEGATEREVYLPAGVWKDGIDGSLRKGSRWIHKYRVPQNKVAYFEKMPDSTRFK